MKKICTIVVALVATVSMAKAQIIDFAYEAGAEVVSAYLWRGQYDGGLSFQPTASVGFNLLEESIQFRVGAWGNLGASDWKFRFGLPEDAEGYNPNTYFVPEVDIFATLNVFGLTAGFTHYYYFGGTPFFSRLNDDGGSQTEVQLGYNFGTLTPIGLYFNWYTMVAGNDAWYDSEDIAHRAWSSYIELGYDLELPLDFTIGVQVGMTPWRSLYTDYEGGFAVNNISLRLGKTWEVGDVCEIELFGQGALNTYGLNKDNVFISEAGDYKLGNAQKLNGCLGLGVWF